MMRRRRRKGSDCMSMQDHGAFERSRATRDIGVSGNIIILYISIGD